MTIGFSYAILEGMDREVVKRQKMGKIHMTLALSPEEKLLMAIFDVDPDNAWCHNEVNGVTLKEAMGSVLSTLTARECRVLHMRFGFEDPLGTSQTLVEVGKVFDVTRERIRQIERRALRRLRHCTHSKELKPYLIKYCIE